ncbi:E3 ubiquitin-protein ligase Topors-like [Pelodiscus sinensis]|uniref:E3 ubiquitin-protein ligase Topors-like n=1 Tax=Pelodiscus sinensis TaxID=13735 RepID=UPI003F6A7668
MASSNEAFKSDGSFSSIAGTSSGDVPAAAEGSSDSRCPICLERIQNVSYLNPCFHGFCFACIQEWSERKAECPLCKQYFHSFFHTIRADNDFEEYILPVENISSAMFEVRSTSAQRPESPPDHGILREGFSGPRSQAREWAIEELMRQFAIRRPSQPGGISLGQVREQVTIKFRRALYRSGVWVRNVQAGGFYRDISADFFHRNPSRLHRLVPWLKRELRVLCGTRVSLVNDIQHIILHNMTHYDLESQAFADLLQPHLLYYTNHFLHEFINFARSPFNIKAYDWRANYDIPFSLHEEGYQFYSSLTMSSEEEEDSQDYDDEDDDGESIGSNDEESWDDEIPGSACSSLEQAVDDLISTLGSSDGEFVRRDNLQRLFQTHACSVENTNHSSSDNCFINSLAERMVDTFEPFAMTVETNQDGGKEEKKLQPVRDPHSSNSHGCLAISRDGQFDSQRHDSPPLPQQIPEREVICITDYVQSEVEAMGNSEQIQAKSKELVTLELIQSKTAEAVKSESLLSQGEAIVNNKESPSSTDNLPSSTSKKRDSRCFPCIRRS